MDQPTGRSPNAVTAMSAIASRSVNLRAWLLIVNSLVPPRAAILPVRINILRSKFEEPSGGFARASTGTSIRAHAECEGRSARLLTFGRHQADPRPAPGGHR